MALEVAEESFDRFLSRSPEYTSTGSGIAVYAVAGRVRVGVTEEVGLGWRAALGGLAGNVGGALRTNDG